MAADILSSLRSGRLAGATHLDLRGLGLAEVPREVLALADTLEVLDLSRNRLTELPPDFARLKKLRLLFGSENPFRALPEVLHACPSLSMVGFKSCGIETVGAGALPRDLRWLILTDNRIRTLPPELGRCTKLQKLMLSGNRLESLPETMKNCTRLELVRLASNQFQALPDWLPALPRLAWLAVAGNPVVSAPSPAHGAPGMARIGWGDLEIQARIGEGASGVIYEARLGGEPVAVKLFKGAMTSDGLPGHEMAACLAAGRHPNVVGALGRITGAPDGADGLVMPLLDKEFVPLAGPPSLDSCTRDVYPQGMTLEFTPLLRLATSIATAGEHLHSRHVFHGDLYAHNILWNQQGQALLGDFGAATWCQIEDENLAGALRRLDVRAFGILLEELLQRCDFPGASALHSLQGRCLGPQPPAFAAMGAELRAMRP